MKRFAIWFVVFSGLALGSSLDFRAGVAKIDITPEGPIWLSGYAARTSPSKGVARRIFARALAIESKKGGRLVLVSTDLIGLPMTVTDQVSARLQKDLGLDRSQLVFNSSHTHTGPMLNRNLAIMEPDDEGERERIRQYTQQVASHLEEAVRQAMAKLQPARLAFGAGQVGFAINRREFRQEQVVLGENPKGPVDHRVPVMRVENENGQIIGLLFGYACHNTTLTAEFYEISGDYAGEAAATLEAEFPGATALFFELCAGDQNPHPRSRAELIITHGNALAAEVARVARTSVEPVQGRIRASYRIIQLPFAPHTREQFVEEARSSDKFRVRRARAMLAKYDDRTVPRSLNYPVQVIRFDRGFTLIALAGEVVVDYALWSYRTFPQEKLMVAGYSNDVPCYIPSVRILREGGYEAETSMIYYGQPGRFSEEVEGRIQEAVAAGMKRARR